MAALLSPGFVRLIPRTGFLVERGECCPAGSTSHCAGVCLGSAGDLGEPGNPTQAKAQAAKKASLVGANDVNT